MDKRYQVFISSTFKDLKDERQSVLRAILEIDHMPAGMELFPAADSTAWQIIKDVIDASDYYVLVIGGRYGSLDEEGIGFTEKEYDYAVSAKKPVIPFLHEHPDNLPRDRTETDHATWEKLKKFRAKVEERHTCVYWKSAEDLKAKVIVGMTAAMKRVPAVGWVRADKVPTEATVTEILSLRQRIVDLEAQIAEDRISPPVGVEDLYQGSDRFEVHAKFKARKHITNHPYKQDTGYTGSIMPTWNEMFAAVAPTMINEAPDDVLKQALRDYLRQRGIDQWKDTEGLKGQSLFEFEFRDDEIDTCIVQFRALGLIKESQKNRSVKDIRTFWALTPYGDQLMTQLRALRRPPLEKNSGTKAKAMTDTETSGKKKTVRRSAEKKK